MLDAFAIAGILSALIWAYLLLARGGFWRVTVWHGSPTRVPGLIAAIIPARNEADVIARSIGSLLNQTSAGPIHIFLVDDASTDGTAQVAREAAGDNPALTVITGAPLPLGWTGKLWAMQQGIEAAGALHPAFFLLTDADIEHAPDNVTTLTAIAERGGCDLTSLMVKLRCDTIAEKLLIPAFVFFFFKLYPPAWIAHPQRRTAGAAGGCMLLRPQALARAGGLQTIRGEVIDDCALARLLKRSGGKVWLGPATSAFSLRPYGSFREIGHMIARSAFNQLHHSALLLLAAVVWLALTYLLPVVLLFSGRPLLMALGAAVWAMMTISYLPMIRYYRLNPIWALLLPAAATFYMGATLVSAVKYWSGRGGEWKGRVQDAQELRSKN
jgi:hopene-associated glycosyltransferase HpnB